MIAPSFNENFFKRLLALIFLIASNLIKFPEPIKYVAKKVLKNLKPQPDDCLVCC